MDEPEVTAAVTEATAPEVETPTASEPTPAPVPEVDGEARRLLDFRADAKTLDLKALQKKYPDLAQELVVPHVSRGVTEAQKGWEQKQQAKARASEWLADFNRYPESERLAFLSDPANQRGYNEAIALAGANGTAQIDPAQWAQQAADNILNSLREIDPDAPLEDAEDYLDAIKKTAAHVIEKERKTMKDEIKAMVAEELAKIHTGATQPERLTPPTGAVGSDDEFLKDYAAGRSHDRARAQRILNSLT